MTIFFTYQPNQPKPTNSKNQCSSFCLQDLQPGIGVLLFFLGVYFFLFFFCSCIKLTIHGKNKFNQNLHAFRYNCRVLRLAEVSEISGPALIFKQQTDIKTIHEKNKINGDLCSFRYNWRELILAEVSEISGSALIFNHKGT